MHEHCGESRRDRRRARGRRVCGRTAAQTSFIGLDAVRDDLVTATTRTRDTRCYFCKNKCLRTFIDVEAAGKATRTQGEVETASSAAGSRKSKVPLAAGAQRLIVATCEKGTVEDVEEMREIKKGSTRSKAHPNFVEIAAPATCSSRSSRNSWPIRRRRASDTLATEDGGARTDGARAKSSASACRGCSTCTPTARCSRAISKPRASAPDNLVYSRLHHRRAVQGRRQARRHRSRASRASSASRTCTISLSSTTRRSRSTSIFFPMIDDLTERPGQDAGSPGVPDRHRHARGGQGGVHQGRRSVRRRRASATCDPLRQHRASRSCSRARCRRVQGHAGSVAEGKRCARSRPAIRRSTRLARRLRREAREVLDQLEARERIGIVVLGTAVPQRPRHQPRDPGRVPEARLSGVHAGFACPSTKTCWIACSATKSAPATSRVPCRYLRRVEERYSENTSQKVWAAKYVARHPNLVALELSNFKCGHDAPIYSVVEEIIECSGTPYFCFKDLDENDPPDRSRFASRRSATSSSVTAKTSCAKRGSKTRSATRAPRPMSPRPIRPPTRRVRRPRRGSASPDAGAPNRPDPPHRGRRFRSVPP